MLQEFVAVRYLLWSSYSLGKLLRARWIQYLEKGF